MADSQTYRLEKFGADGVVTDLSPDQLKTSQLASAENMVLPDGIPTERGGWSGYGALDPYNGFEPEVPEFDYALNSCMAVVDPVDGSTQLVVCSDSGAGLGLATVGNAGYTGYEDGFVVREQHRGEVLVAHSDGVFPVGRYGLSIAALAGGDATLALAEGEKVVTGVGSSYLTTAIERMFVSDPWDSGHIHRIALTESDTTFVVSDPADHPVSVMGMFSSPLGEIGLMTLVTDTGTISRTEAAWFTVTGKGTRWTSSGPGFGALRGGDIILPRSEKALENAMVVVTSGLTDTTMTVYGKTTTPYTDEPYVALRPAVGSEVCSHENAVWIAGVAWNRSTLYTAPAGAPLSNVTNGRWGKTVDTAEAVRMLEVEVPEAHSSPIVALRSTPWGLAVAKSDSLYRVTGQYPALDVRKVADLGTVDRRAAVSVDDTFVFAGLEGIHVWRGGGIDDISGGRRGEWRAKIKGSGRCVLGVVKGHLFVSFDAYGTTPECWVYDLGRDVHLGNFTSEAPAAGIESATWMDSARIPGEPDRLLFTVPDTSVRQVQDASTTLIEAGQQNPVPATNLGPLRAVSGTNVGGAISRMRRVVGVKVSYVCAGTAPGVLSLLVGNDGAAPGAERDLPATTAISTVRVAPRTGSLGARARSVQVEFTRTGGASVDRVAIHEVEIVGRARRPRA